MVVNRQRAVPLNLSSVRGFIRRLKSELELGGRDFDVAFVADTEIARLNGEFRGKPRITDVLSFPWNNGTRESRISNPLSRISGREFGDFLGDIVISAPAARRNAIDEGHSIANEIRWLTLHGVLHLLGYDHETDSGEMTAVELGLRTRLGIEGQRSRSPRRMALRSTPTRPAAGVRG